MPFSVRFQAVADEDLGPLLKRGAELGYVNPTVEVVDGGRESVVAARSAATDPSNELVSHWELVEERRDQSYRWPEFVERYPGYDVYMGRTAREGVVYFGIGWTERRDRPYAVVFLSQRAPQVPISEFLAADDFPDTGEVLAIIRGSDGGRKMYAPGDPLPDIYARNFRTVVYRDRVRAKGAYYKVAVIAHKDDMRAILNHALIQARRRGDL